MRRLLQRRGRDLSEAMVSHVAGTVFEDMRERWAVRKREGPGRSLSAGVHGAPGGAEEVDAEVEAEEE